MDVGVDSVWASPSTLHMRVLVWVGPRKHQMKFYASVPLAEIEPSAVQALIALQDLEPDPTTDPQQGVLFGA